MRTTLSAVVVVCTMCFILAGCSGGNASATVQITGRVMDSATGKPVAGVLVELGTARAMSDSNGNFTLTGVPTGEQRFSVIPPEGYTAPAPIIINVPPTASTLADLGTGEIGSYIYVSSSDSGGTGGGPPPPPII